MRLLWLMPALLAAGCATQIPASQASNFELCEFTMSGGQNAIVAQAEAKRRGLDCVAYYPAINAKRAREAAASDSALRYFQPRPMPIPQPTNCTSRAVGRTIQMDCW